MNKTERSETMLPTDGGIWICETCKTVIGPIVDDDENKCGCDVYEFAYSRYIPDTRPDAKDTAADEIIIKKERWYKNQNHVRELRAELATANKERDEAVKRSIELEVALQAYAKYQNKTAMERDIRLLNDLP